MITLIRTGLKLVKSDEIEQAEGSANVLFEQYFGKNTEYADQYEACYNMAKDLDTFFADAEDC